MATIEQLNLAFQTMQHLVGLRRDMRANAVGAKQAVDRGVQTPEGIAREHNANADNYIKRMNYHSRLENDLGIQGKLAAGLAAFGLTKPEVDADIAMFEAASATYRAAPKTTNQEIIDASDALLNEVAHIETLFEMK